MGLLNWFINPNDALRRRVERAFLLKDSEINRRLMKEMNNEAEREKGMKKGEVGLKKKNKARDVQNLEKGARSKEKMVLREGKNTLKGAPKEDGVKCGLEREGANMKHEMPSFIIAVICSVK